MGSWRKSAPVRPFDSCEVEGPPFGPSPSKGSLRYAWGQEVKPRRRLTVHQVREFDKMHRWLVAPGF
jgi:hypothetical protein